MNDYKTYKLQNELSNRKPRTRSEQRNRGISNADLIQNVLTDLEEWKTRRARGRTTRRRLRKHSGSAPWSPSPQPNKSEKKGNSIADLNKNQHSFEKRQKPKTLSARAKKKAKSLPRYVEASPKKTNKDRKTTQESWTKTHKSVCTIPQRRCQSSSRPVDSSRCSNCGWTREHLQKCSPIGATKRLCCCKFCLRQNKVCKETHLQPEHCLNNNHTAKFTGNYTYSGSYRNPFNRRYTPYSSRYNDIDCQIEPDFTQPKSFKELTDLQFRKSFVDYVPEEINPQTLRERLMNSAIDLKVKDIRRKWTKSLRKKEFELIEKYMYLKPPLDRVMRRSHSADESLRTFKPSAFCNIDEPYRREELHRMSNYSNNFSSSGNLDLNLTPVLSSTILPNVAIRRSMSTGCRFGSAKPYDSGLSVLSRSRLGLNQKLKYASDYLNNESFYSGLRKHELKVRRKDLEPQYGYGSYSYGLYPKTRTSILNYSNNTYPIQPSNFSVPYYDSSLSQTYPVSSSDINSNKIPFNFNDRAITKDLLKPRVGSMSYLSEASNGTDYNTYRFERSNITPDISKPHLNPCTNFSSSNIDYTKFANKDWSRGNKTRNCLNSEPSSNSCFAKAEDFIPSALKHSTSATNIGRFLKPLSGSGTWESKYSCEGFNNPTNSAAQDFHKVIKKESLPEASCGATLTADDILLKYGIRGKRTEDNSKYISENSDKTHSFKFSVKPSLNFKYLDANNSHSKGSPSRSNAQEKEKPPLPSFDACLSQAIKRLSDVDSLLVKAGGNYGYD